MLKNNTSSGRIKIPGVDGANWANKMDYLRRLQELAVNTFEWRGLPSTVDPRFLEMVLFSTGMALFFHDDIADRYLATMTMIGGRLDVYQVPMFRTAVASNGYRYRCTIKDSVIIFNNYLREPDFPTLEIYAQRLEEIQKSIDVNVKAQKFPLIVQATESQRLTMKNLMKQYEDGQPIIFGEKGLDLTGVKVIDTAAPYVADKLQDLKARTWNEAIAFLGIETANTEKNERLITDEVSANLGYTHAQRAVRLNMRQQACEKINRMFGLNVSVSFREETKYMAILPPTASQTPVNEEVGEYV